MNQEEFKAQYEDKILSNIDFVNSKGNYWLKLKYNKIEYMTFFTINTILI